MKTLSATSSCSPDVEGDTSREQKTEIRKPKKKKTENRKQTTESTNTNTNTNNDIDNLNHDNNTEKLTATSTSSPAVEGDTSRENPQWRKVHSEVKR